LRISKLFGKTQREVTADAETISHQLLLKSGMIYQVAAGVYSYLPLGWRVLKKIENIIRDEMDRAGGQELMLPVLQPIELWRKTGRDAAFGKSLFTLLDRRERQLVLGPTHEEIITELASHHIKSYRDLPLLLYQIQTKFRDEPRPRGGLLRVREFGMKDLYSFDSDEAGLDRSYDRMLQAYKAIYDRCGLCSVLVEADSGAIGGKDSHEFMVVTETGEDEIVSCPECGYTANMEKAQSIRRKPAEEKPLPLEKVSTPGITTIKDIADFLGVPQSRTLKAVFYNADGELAIVVIRGDIEVNEVKLKNTLSCSEMRLATDAELAEAGLIAGSASPVGIKGIRVIADESVPAAPNLIAGGNKPDTHIKNVNYERDFNASIVADIAQAAAGEGCPKCDGTLISSHGIEVGHIFKLGTFLSKKLGACFTDANGESKPVIMGCYGIGLGRLLAAAIEQNHDDKGIVWPTAIAPYHIHLCPLYKEGSQVAAVTGKLYDELIDMGVEVLYDDRQESPGVKFNDADLLGIPIRVTVSPRSLEKDSIEIKRRSADKPELLPQEGISARLAEMVKE